jgi:DNA-binding XRE family transcriptional regulator
VKVSYSITEVQQSMTVSTMEHRQRNRTLARKHVSIGTIQRIERQKALGNAVAKRRMKLKLSQRDLARLMGCTQGNISHIESGHTNVTLDAICKLAEALRMKPWDLIRR